MYTYTRFWRYNRPQDPSVWNRSENILPPRNLGATGLFFFPRASLWSLASCVAWVSMSCLLNLAFPELAVSNLDKLGLPWWPSTHYFLSQKKFYRPPPRWSESAIHKSGTCFRSVFFMRRWNICLKTGEQYHWVVSSTQALRSDVYSSGTEYLCWWAQILIWSFHYSIITMLGLTMPWHSALMSYPITLGCEVKLSPNIVNLFGGIVGINGSWIDCGNDTVTVAVPVTGFTRPTTVQ